MVLEEDEKDGKVEMNEDMNTETDAESEGYNIRQYLKYMMLPVRVNEAEKRQIDLFAVRLPPIVLVKRHVPVPSVVIGLADSFMSLLF